MCYISFAHNRVTHNNEPVSDTHNSCDVTVFGTRDVWQRNLERELCFPPCLFADTFVILAKISLAGISVMLSLA